MLCFGFSPLRLPADLDFASLFHGIDERVPVESLQFGVRVLDRGPELCAIATAEPAGLPAERLKLALRARGINVSSPERVDAVIDMDDKRARSALRFSPHYYNTAEEIDHAVDTLGRLLRETASA